MRLEPNSPFVLFVKSNFALNSGKLDMAIKLQLKLRELNPLAEDLYYYLGFYYWMNGQFDKAEENVNRLLLLYSNESAFNGMMGRVQLSLGHPEKALTYMEKDIRPFWDLYGKSLAVYAMGNSQKANELLKQLIADWGDKAWPNIADIYAFRGEKDEAFKWLDLAYENRDSSLQEILNLPWMKNLWGDPRWNIFINKLGLPEDHGYHLD